MNKITDRKLLLLLSILVGLYSLFSFLPPILMKSGYSELANKGYQFYEKFCHQRVERSLFLFGEKSFYSVRKLKEDEYIKIESISNEYPEYYGHGFNGSKDLGYKVAICIRDIALYSTFAISLIFFSLRKREVKISNLIAYLLIATMIIDIAIQIPLGILHAQGFGLLFIDNIPKRIVTGILAGFGLAVLISKIVKYENN